MNLLFFFNFLLNLVAISETKMLASRSISSSEYSIVARKWEMQEIRFLYNNTSYYYNKEDDSNTNINFDNDYITFYCGGTGIYHQGDNINYPIQWHSIELKNNAIQFTISKFRNNSDLLVTWENIEILGNTIKYMEYYTHKGGMNCLGYGIRKTIDTVSTPPNIIAINSVATQFATQR